MAPGVGTLVLDSKEKGAEAGRGCLTLLGVPSWIMGAGPEDGGIAWGCEVMGRVKKEKKQILPENRALLY